MAKNLINYLPDAFREIKEYKEVFSSEDTELLQIRSDINEIIDNFFILSATESGLKRYENIFGVIPMADDSIEVRRLRLISMSIGMLPYTEKSLNDMLIKLCGEDGFSIIIDKESYYINIRIALTKRGGYSEIEKFCRNIIPANMKVDLSLMYNTYGDAAKLTHGQLNDLTHYEIKNKENLYG